MFLIMGIGNPGDKYKNTPHNIGFILLDSLSASSPWKKSKKSLIQTIQYGDTKVILAKPTTYVNLSGEAAVSLLNFFKIEITNFAVIVDDANLNIGAIRIRQSGSDGGHNGLKSIIQHCGDGFARIRIGIGRCPTGTNLSTHVLSNLSKEHKQIIQEIEAVFPELMENAINHGWEDTACKYNRKGLANPSAT